MRDTGARQSSKPEIIEETGWIPPDQHGLVKLGGKVLGEAPAAIRVGCAPGGTLPHIVELPEEHTHGLHTHKHTHTHNNHQRK
jgi:hypothetical protein